MEYNPEQSPYFRGYEYKSRVHELLDIGGKATFWKSLPLKEVNKWAEQKGSGVAIAFADENPEYKVIIDEDGEKKTVTLPRWARMFEKTKPERYYSESPWVYRCVDIKARALAAVEWNIYPEDDPEAEAHPPDNDAVSLLREVNPEKNWPDLATAISKDLDLYGTAYIWKVRAGEESPRTNVEGEVRFLRRLNPATIKVIADNMGISHFEQRTSGDTREYARENIIYLRDYDPDNDYGSVAPLTAAEKAVKVELSANDHLADFFDNYAMPAMIMSTKESVQDADLKRLAGNWAAEFKGKGKRGKTAFLSHGYEPKELSYPPKDLALQDIRQEARRAICSAFGVPSTLAGAWEAANYATMTGQRKSLYTETILPRAAYIEGVINAELMSEFDGEYFFRFEPEHLEVMQEDTKSRAEWIGILVEKRIIKPEVAAVEMGYTEEDVPEPQPNPFLGAQGRSESNFQARAMNIAPEGQKTLTALTKYRRKAKNRIKDERTPVCDFTSKYVPRGMVKAIMADLEDADTLDDVDDIFEIYGLEPHD